jgi:CRISPR/Cas system-associated exonuclease Cas4 (RecB family)
MPAPDNRPVWKVHSIADWMALDDATRVLILRNIRLKERLWSYFYDMNLKGNTEPLKESKWVPCIHCNQKGWVARHPRYPGIHPSQLPGPCLLRIYNEMIGLPQSDKTDAKGRMIFDIGTAIHEILQASGWSGFPDDPEQVTDAAVNVMMMKYGLGGAWGDDYESEVTVSSHTHALAKELMIEGHVDAENILRIDDVPGLPYVFEVGLVHEYKSINQNGFDKLTRPKPEHTTQATIYAAVLDRPVVVYLYVNKNDSNMADFPVAFDPTIWEPLKQKCVTLKSYFETQTTPPATINYGCKDCRYAFSCDTYKSKSKIITKAT